MGENGSIGEIKKRKCQKKRQQENERIVSEKRLTCFLPVDLVNRARTPTASPTTQTNYITHLKSYANILHFFRDMKTAKDLSLVPE